LLALGILLLTLAATSSVQAQSSITYSDTQTYTFGQQAIFSIEAAAPDDITGVYLYLQPEGSAAAEALPVPIESGSEVTATIQRDLRTNPFPPFGTVSWWWEIHDAGGNVLSTEPKTFRYTDNRFEWHTTTDGRVTLHTVISAPQYVQTAMEVTQTSLQRVESQLQAEPVAQVDLYLYPSTEDLRAALEMAGRNWAGGQARPELGVILVAVPDDNRTLSRMERDIPHELTHLIVYSVAGPEGYRHVPAWLDEGLATANELRPDPALEVVLDQARAEGRLLPLTALCPPFPTGQEAALLAYAQSASLVRTVRDRYGNAGIRDLMAAYADGAGCESGIEHGLGITDHQFERTWRADLMGLSGWMAWISDNAAPLLLWGIGLILALPMAAVFRRRSNRHRK
jgi:hypothetical protein